MDRILPFALALALASSSALAAQETDQTQTPNPAGAGIVKSYVDQIGPGRGDVMTPGSSAYLIARDPFRAIARGRQVFQRKFTGAQGVGPRTLDGQGAIDADASLGAGLSDSCAACHGRPQGAAGFGGDVFTRPTSRDAPHLFGLGLQEMLADEITQDLRAQRDDALASAATLGAPVAVKLASKGIAYGTLVALPGGGVEASGVEGVDADLRVRPFFAQGATTSIREFLVGAFNAEMGLESCDPDLAAAKAGASVTTPSGMVLDGALDLIEAPPALGPLDDPDLDGVLDEIPQSIVDYLEFYLLNYFRPARRVPAGAGPMPGESLFSAVGCAECHVPALGIERDRRVADVETRLDRANGNPFNHLFATAQTLHDEIDDGTGHPTLKPPRHGRFLVEGFYADLKRHDVGPAFWERNFDGSIQKEFMTEPLWGVASTAPYGHDGRSPTLEDVILRHGGEAEASRQAFEALSRQERAALLAFLGTLVLFSPPATASNLDPAVPATADYPVYGHGSIRLAGLFHDPSDLE